MTGPKRILLSNEALMLAEGIARGGRPSPSTVQFFQESGLAEDGFLDPTLSHVLRVLDSAALAITATRLIPGSTNYQALSLAAPAGDADFVAKGGSDEVRDLLWLGPATDAAVHLADFLGLAAPASDAQSQSFDLTRDGWFALCALADFQVLTHLRAQIDAVPAAPPTVEALERLTTETLGRADTYRAAFAAERLAPESGTRPDIASGIASLPPAILTSAEPVELSPEGRLVVESVAQALVWGQVTAFVAGQDGPPACLTTLRGVTNALLIGWNADGTACSVTVHDAPSATYALYSILLDTVERSAAQPTPESPQSTPAAPDVTTSHARFCASCGNQLSPSAKFCAACGNPVAT